jgi:FkbH-like protein
VSLSLADLPWLPPAPDDFRGALAAAASAAGLARLANHRLGEPQLVRLAKALGRLSDTAPLTPFRLAVLSNATTELLLPALVGTALRHGLALEVSAAPFDQAVQQALDPASALHGVRPDAVLLAFDARGYGIDGHHPALTGAEAAAKIDGALAKVATIRAGLARGCAAPLLVQTLAPPPKRLFGGLDRRIPGSASRLAAAFNDRLAEAGDLLFDVAALAETVGLESWHDPSRWHHAKLAFAPRLVPLYADHLARLLAALRGKARKCLVLDLDNTCWAGVIGDDGLEGIGIGQGDALGEAHLAVQRAALDLRTRGVVLAVCSKNDDAIARRPFRDHPDMLLREDHIAVFQANWIDKPTNLKAIAKQLNIGTDALVFLDDNPVERALVRREMPEVAVPELPEDAAYYPRMLLAAGYFEAVAFSAEDRGRAEQYQANARRAELESSATDLDSYLRSLEMVLTLAPFDALGRARIAQLINKSNQFNLTTRRYTEAEVARLEDDAAVFTLQARLLDGFGDNGMISVVIVRASAAVWEFDTWLMSCRVLGRRVEEAVLAAVAGAARTAGAKALVGRYIASGRNGMVEDHYRKLGFAPAGTEGEATLWRLDLAGWTPPALPLAIESTLP